MRRLSLASRHDSPPVLRVRRVLVAVDFSTPSLAAARWVARHMTPGADVVLAHVLPVPRAPAFLRAHLRSPEAFAREVAPPLRGGLEGLAATLGTGRVEVELRVGDPAEQLADLAAEHRVDLISVGRPRHTGDTVKLGRNTVDRLLRQASVPLLQAAGALEAAPASILVAVDGGDGSERVLGAAASLAERLEARLAALHVLDEDVRAYVRAMEVAIGAARDAGAAEHSLRATTARWLATALEEAGARAGRHETIVRQGDPGQEVLGTARKLGAEMIVLGRDGHDAISPNTVGSTTRLVLRAAPCPVLVVPDRAQRVGPDGPERGIRQLPVARAVAPVGAAAAPRGVLPGHDGDDDGVPPAAERLPA